MILIINTFSIIIYIYNIIVYVRLSNSFKHFANNLDYYFTKNNTYIIPFEKRAKFGTCEHELSTAKIHLIQSLIYNILIFFIYKTIEKYKRRIKSSKNK